MSKKILCIEDEQFIGELYARAIEKAGHKIKVIANGQDGLKEALANQYDVIIVDIMLPGIDGNAIIDGLIEPKSGNRYVKSKIIVATNLNQKEEDREKLEKLTDMYLIKAEITPKELVTLIDKV